MPAHNSTPSLVGTSTFRDENFLKKEYELARNQVTTNNQNLKNLIQDKNNNVNVIITSINGDNKNSAKSIVVTKNDNKELLEVRNKILSKSNNSNATNNMMVNGEMVNGTGSGDSIDDIKFIDSDDNLSDKRMSPPSSNSITAPTHVTKMLANSTPISSSNRNNTSDNNATTTRQTITLKTNTYPPKHSQSVSPNNKILILNASPKNSCVYEKQQKLEQKMSILTNNHHQIISDTSKAASTVPKSTTMVTKTEPATTTILTTSAGTARIKVITTDTDDEDDFTNVSTSATIILPSKAQNGCIPSATVVVKNSSNAKKGSDKDRNNDGNEATSLSSIFLEKKNLANNKSNDSNDSVS